VDNVKLGAIITEGVTHKTVAYAFRFIITGEAGER